jgi:hypothetical protein
MPRLILPPFQKFVTEDDTIGRLLAGYSNLEIGLMHCVQMAQGNDFDTVLKRMFERRGETRRINEAEKLFVSYHQHHGCLENLRRPFGLSVTALAACRRRAHLPLRLRRRCWPSAGLPSTAGDAV